MTTDRILVKRSFAAMEPHGPVVAEYFHQHLFEHDPGVRGLFAEHLDGQRDRLFAGDEWTPEAEAAWTAVYGVVSDTMGAALTEARSA